MEGLVIGVQLPPDLAELDAETLLHASNIPDMDNLDEIFSQVPNPGDITIPEPDSTSQPDRSEQNGDCISEATQSLEGRFGKLVDDTDIKAAQDMAVPANIKKSTSWSAKVWKDWSAHRRAASPSDWPPHLLICTPWELNRWMSRFVLEVRRQDGKHYPPNTLYQLCCGLMRYVREVKPDLDIFKDLQFSEFCRTLDAEMKRLRSLGIGTSTKQAEPITDAEEERLWIQGKLGPDTPQSLLDTMVYMCGLYFALRSGQEHRNLSVDQLKLVEPADGVPHLVYTENVSKNNPGGLHNRKLKPKTVIHHANLECPSRCLVMFYKTYMAHRPPDLEHNAFYLTPIRNPKTSVWYTSVPVGYRTLMTTVNRICKSASINGYKTNHSLRVTAATRLFQQSVDEQLIMSRTGHRSIDVV